MQAQVYLEGHRGRKSELAGHGLRKQVAEAKDGPWSFGGGGAAKEHTPGVGEGMGMLQRESHQKIVS